MITKTVTMPIPSDLISNVYGDHNRLKIDFLDGIRGLAAFTVLLGHAFWSATNDDNGKISASLSPLFVDVTRVLNFPHYAVAVFIVLSGFCLMLPVTRSQDHMLPGGILGFAKRRARRILPPYYIALAFVLGILFISHHFLKHSTDSLADTSAGNIVSHLLLIHNLFKKYNMAIDVPMWSVAWEWQIYFLFALVLLPVWRRFGIVSTTITAFLIGYLPLILLPKESNLNWTCPWYIGLFALGMMAAVVLCSPTDRYCLIKKAILQNIVICCIAGGMLILMFLHPQWLGDTYYWISDPLAGALAALFILACATQARSNWLFKAIVKGLESRKTMTLGAFSYSLYLIHSPILKKIHDILHPHHFSHYFQFALLLLVGVPVCLVGAYLFHIAFERPFMPGRPKTDRNAEVAALISPAP